MEVSGVRLTSPDKVLWPTMGVTKLQLAEYFAAEAERILLHVKDRPVSLFRCPAGVSGDCFFQKHRGKSTPSEIGGTPVREASGETKDYILVETPEALIACAQIGALELHVWGARVGDLEQPERVVFDLDPGEGTDFSDVKTAARDVRDRLDRIGLASFPMLTGGSGVHVIAPLDGKAGWDRVKAFAEDMARAMEADDPERYVATSRKDLRKGRIFIDWLRNARGSTGIAPFSPRARKGAPVATPIAWDELGKAASGRAYTLATIGKRLSALKRDPWEGYFDVKQGLG